MLSSKMMSAPASAACATCSRVSASTSIFSFGNFSRARETAAAMAFGFSFCSAARWLSLIKIMSNKSEAMIFSAAAGDGVFFKAPPAGRRFARVENLRASSFDCLDELRSQSGDAGKPLDKIQRDALGAQNRARRAGNFQQHFPGGNSLSIANQFFNFDFRRQFVKSSFGKLNSSDNELFSRAHDGD